MLFKLDIAIPATQIAGAFSISLTESDHSVIRIEADLQKAEAKKPVVSNLNATLYDPGRKLFSKLPDPAYADVPLTLYMTDNKGKNLENVFEGIITHIGLQYPEDKLEITAQDKAVYARRSARLEKSIKGLNPVQLAKKIADIYGLDIESDTGDLDMSKLIYANIVHVGAFGSHVVSDMGVLQSLLFACGLSFHMKGKKMIIQQTPNAVYPTTFRPDDGNVINLNVGINHVKSPGGQGNITATKTAFDGADVQRALKDKKETSAQKGGDGTTSRQLPGGKHRDTTGPHAEDTKAGRWENVVTKLRGRKDEGTLTLNAAPGLTLSHLVNLDGFGGKADGLWEVTGVRHVLVPDDGGAVSTVSLARGTSKGSAKQSGGAAFAFEGAV